MKKDYSHVLDFDLHRNCNNCKARCKVPQSWCNNTVNGIFIGKDNLLSNKFCSALVVCRYVCMFEREKLQSVFFFPPKLLELI